eukprot:gb/GECH01006218.1/.p1 GENE.gb/GECH01006218.1/~~gb/GECH01006218.1/.p1  ORF type:complete len:145 (+),score=22.41 gb/GECH01006218.1/:1-435(+)
MKIKTFMVPRDSVVTCLPESLLHDLTKPFIEENIGSIIVIREDSNIPIGIITKTDLVRASYIQQCDCHTTLARDVMSGPLEIIHQDKQGDEAAERMQQLRIKHLIVVDDDNRFVGLTTAWDVVREAALDSKHWPYNRGVLSFSK